MIMFDETSYKAPSDYATFRFDAEKMVRSITEITPEPVSEDFLARALLERVPLLRDFLESGTGAGTTLSDLVSTQELATGFHIGSVALSAIDLVRLPFFYLAAFIMGQKAPPFKLSDSLKMLYSASLVAFGVAGLLVPPLVPSFLTVAGVVGVGLGVSGLIQLYRDRASTNAQLDSVRKALQAMQSEIKPLQNEALELKKAFDVIMDDKEKTFFQKRGEATTYLSRINDLERRFDSDFHPKLQILLNQEAQYAAKLKVMKNASTVMNRSVGVALAVLGLVGAVMLFVFPPAGLGILAAGALLSGGYLLARFAGPWLAARLKSKPVPAEPKNTEPAKTDANVPTDTVAPHLDPHRSPEVLLKATSDSSPATQAVFTEVLCDVERLRSITPRPSPVSLVPQPFNEISGAVSSGDELVSQKGMKQSLQENKELELNAQVLTVNKGIKETLRDEAEEDEGEGEGEGPTQHQS